MARPVLVEAHLPGFVGEGHLYRYEGTDYLVFRTATAAGWDVAERTERGRFGPIVVHGATSRAEAVRRLADARR